MIMEEDLVLVENAMNKSKEKIGYLLNCVSGKRFVSSISIDDIFEKAKSEEYKYLIIYCEDEKKVFKKIKIEKIKNNVNKNFVIYISTENEVKKYKI